MFRELSQMVQRQSSTGEGRHAVAERDDEAGVALSADQLEQRGPLGRLQERDDQHGTRLWFGRFRRWVLRVGVGGVPVRWPALRLPRAPIPQGGTFVVEVDGRPLPRTLEGVVTVAPTAFPVEELRFAPETAALLDSARIEQETAVLREAYGGFAPARRWEGFFARPCDAAVSDVYGARRRYQGGLLNGSHAGVDFGAPSGAPVLAAAGARGVAGSPTGPRARPAVGPSLPPAGAGAPT